MHNLKIAVEKGILDGKIVARQCLKDRERYKCTLCGYDTEERARTSWVLGKQDIIFHIITVHNIDYRLIKKHGIHPLKPWEDPESLFCDTQFLEKIIGKEPLKGNQCKDD